MNEPDVDERIREHNWAGVRERIAGRESAYGLLKSMDCPYASAYRIGRTVANKVLRSSDAAEHARRAERCESALAGASPEQREVWEQQAEKLDVSLLEFFQIAVELGIRRSRGLAA